MSEQTPEQKAYRQAQADLAKTRLLKANNVQRRRFEKMADRVIAQSIDSLNTTNREDKTITEKALIREALGADYDKMIECRNRLLSLEAQKEGVRNILEGVKGRSIAKGITNSGYRSWNYYSNPTPPEPDACSIEVGDPTIQGLHIQQCRGNDLYVELEKKTLDLDDEKMDLELASEALRADVWRLVTTDEIVDAITQFKEKHIG